MERERIWGFCTIIVTDQRSILNTAGGCFYRYSDSPMVNIIQCRWVFYTVCSLGEVKKFVLISWAWKVRGSSGWWQNFNDTWTFDKHMLQWSTFHFKFPFFCHKLNFKMLTFWEYTFYASKSIFDFPKISVRFTSIRKMYCL